MDKLDDQAIAHRFTYHPATYQTVTLHGAVRRACLDLADELNGLVPEGREKSLAITKVEEAMFWANAAIARDQTN